MIYIRLADVIEAMMVLPTDMDRLKAMRKFCEKCGKANTECQCSIEEFES